MIPYFAASICRSRSLTALFREVVRKRRFDLCFRRVRIQRSLYGNQLPFRRLRAGSHVHAHGSKRCFSAACCHQRALQILHQHLQGPAWRAPVRRIRFELVDRVLRFPPTALKQAHGAEVSTMVKDEVEPFGGFTGDAFVQP